MFFMGNEQPEAADGREIIAILRKDFDVAVLIDDRQAVDGGDRRFANLCKIFRQNAIVFMLVFHDFPGEHGHLSLILYGIGHVIIEQAGIVLRYSIETSMMELAFFQFGLEAYSSSGMKSLKPRMVVKPFPFSERILISPCS